VIAMARALTLCMLVGSARDIASAASETCTSQIPSECAGGKPNAIAQQEHLLLQLSPVLLGAKASETKVAQDAAEQASEQPSSLADQHQPFGAMGELPWVAPRRSCTSSSISRRRRQEIMCTCRRRTSAGPMLRWLPHEDLGTGWYCKGDTMVFDQKLSRPGANPGAWRAPPGYPGRQAADPGVWRAPPGARDVCSACLCVFDIDRTLTGKQADTRHCPRNRVLPMYDDGYGGGRATLSALAADGISATFCNKCYLGITSAGHGSGEHSQWNRYLLDHVMRSEMQDAFVVAYPESKRWSRGFRVSSPYVLGQSNKVKQNAVELIRRWYGEKPRDVCIRPENVYFFGDRTENIKPFQEKRFNSREISCSSRDHSHGDTIGHCGATPQEVQRETGNILCK